MSTEERKLSIIKHHLKDVICLTHEEHLRDIKFDAKGNLEYTTCCQEFSHEIKRIIDEKGLRNIRL